MRRSDHCAGGEQWTEEDLGRAGISSRAGQGNHSIVKQSSGKSQGLANVFILKLGVFALEFSAVGIGGKGFQDTANGKPEASYARLPIHLTQFNRDPVEFFHRSSHFSGQLPKRALACLSTRAPMRIPEALMEIID
jgi:hypothetical protein